MKPKLFALYLPQFHQIPENDRWWGTGFTEWTAVKKAKPLFLGHNQPRIPWQDNYYNLLNKDTLEWQSNLARKYGVDGFAFYHYWFEYGKKLLEKPAELFLKCKDIDISYCFFWANETWARAWSNISNKNVWMDGANNTSGSGVLMQQSYGDVSLWERHIDYLIPFFQDHRYIKIDNRPLFIVYRPMHLYCLPDMKDVWDRELRKFGFDGIYLVGEFEEVWHPNICEIDAWMYMTTRNSDNKKINCGVELYDYDEYWHAFLRNILWLRDEMVYYCPIVNFDNTPRWGKDGMAYFNVTPEKFQRYMTYLLNIAYKKRHKLIFINAWNEWGEGNYLEPDQKNKFAYLEAIQAAKGNCGEIESYSVNKYTKNYCNVLVSNYREYVEKLERERFIYNSSFALLDYWMRVKRDNKKIVDYFRELHLHCIAIYGFGRIGRHLLSELENSDISIRYIIDRRNSNRSKDIPILQLSNKLPLVDAIIVTPAGQYSEIKNNIKKYIPYKTLSLEHIIYEL